jgi:hypothetical protein
MRILVVVSVLLYLSALPCYAGYIPLGQIHTMPHRSSSTWSERATSVEFYWEYDYFHKLSWGLFSEADVGKTFYVNSSTPNFGLVASRLTNRVDDYITMIVTPPGNGFMYLESRCIEKLVPTKYVDLNGYVVDNIALTINALTIDWQQNTPQGEPLGWVSIWSEVTYTINAIPEPATLLLFGLGLLGVRTSIPRRKK